MHHAFSYVDDFLAGNIKAFIRIIYNLRKNMKKNMHTITNLHLKVLGY